MTAPGSGQRQKGEGGPRKEPGNTPAFTGQGEQVEAAEGKEENHESTGLGRTSEEEAVSCARCYQWLK